MHAEPEAKMLDPIPMDPETDSGDPQTDFSPTEIPPATCAAEPTETHPVKVAVEPADKT
jgi:hypothetical protein